MSSDWSTAMTHVCFLNNIASLFFLMITREEALSAKVTHP
jgi:hypothetical protein